MKRKFEVGDMVRFTPEDSCCLPFPTDDPIGMIQEIHRSGIYKEVGYPYMVETSESIECYADEEIEHL